jgi:hypothetical protein
MTTKYGFRIRTRSGLVVEHLTIHGRDEADAQRKLMQMYHHCEVLECRPVLPGAARSAPRAEPVSFEDVLSLVTK